MNKFRTSNKYYRLWLFGLGIMATISYRSIIILSNYSQVWVKAVWYFGTIGFVWYFAHRYRVQSHREKIIKKRKLLEKISKLEMDADDRDALRYIVRSLSSSKVKWNYVAIFTFSILALIYGVITDFVL